ncbi:glycosyltransferase family 39 protein [Nocardioides korecus]
MSTSTVARPGTPGRPTDHDLPEPHRATTVGRGRRLLLGGEDDPRWARPALLALLAGTALLYLWGLSASGYGNDFYAAAAQAGSRSWKAWLFGSLDSGNAITVDKPPAALWVMGLSVRVFGLSSWSVLAPQALEGVAAVGVLHAAVTRVGGRAAGLVAGAALAITPVAVLMFRFDNPDALLVLLLTVAAYAVVRALESGATRWLVLAGAVVGLGFLSKMGQAFLVLPGFASAYLLAGPPRLGRRLLQLLAALVATVVGAGWFVALVSLWPASSRPYIAGSGDNSELGLALGYNGIGRLLGSSAGTAGGGGGGGNFAGTPGWARLLQGEMAVEISWLLPAALLSLVLGAWLTRRAPRTDLVRASLVLWGGWLLVTAAVLSEMQGGEHPYYTLALAPALAAPTAIVGALAWRRRHEPVALWGGAAMVVVTAVWSAVLLLRSNVTPLLGYAAIAVAAATAVAPILSDLRTRRTAAVVLAGALLATGVGTASFATATAATPHTGTIVYAVSGSSAGGPGGGGGFGGGSDSGSQASTALTALLQSTSTRWAAATVGSNTANTLQLASQKPVMAIGGFNGGDPAPSLAQFKQWVASGQVGYFIAGGNGGGRGPGGGNSAIATWVAAHYKATTVDGYTVYDLT